MASDNLVPILLGLGGLGLLYYVATKGKGSFEPRSCVDVANHLGGTLANPCPTEGPVNVCTQGDYDSWLARLNLQAGTVTQLASRLDQLGLRGDPGFEESLAAYQNAAASTSTQWDPIWTSESDINPIAQLVVAGCGVVNEANRRIVNSGRPELAIQESYITTQYEQAAKKKSEGPFAWSSLPGWVQAALGLAAVTAVVMIVKKSA